MSDIKKQILTLLKQRHHSHKVALEQEKDPRSKHAIDLITRIREDSRLIELIGSLPEETCNDALQVQETCKENPDSFTDKPKELEEAAEEYEDWVESYSQADFPTCVSFKQAFIAGAKWMKSQMPMPEDTVIFMNGVAEGRRLEREDRNDDKLPRYYGD